MIIAAVAEANNRIVVTGNERDFAGVKILNLLRRAVGRDGPSICQYLHRRPPVDMREQVGGSS